MCNDTDEIMQWCRLYSDDEMMHDQSDADDAPRYRQFVRRDKKAWKWNPPKDNKKRDVSGREGGASVSAAMFCAGYTLPSIQYCSECVSSVWCYWFYHEIRVFLPPLFTPDEDYTNVSALVLYFGWVITLFQANMSTSNVKHQNTIRFVNKKLESIYLYLDKLINPIISL